MSSPRDTVNTTCPASNPNAHPSSRRYPNAQTDDLERHSTMNRIDNAQCEIHDKHPKSDDTLWTASLGSGSKLEGSPRQTDNGQYNNMGTRGVHGNAFAQKDNINRPYYESDKYRHFPQRTLSKKPSDGSIRSNFSTTSSVFSTASKISRLPHVVKSSFSSVKDAIVKANRSKSSRNPFPSPEHRPIGTSISQPIPHTASNPSSFSNHSSRLRHRTPSSIALSNIFNTHRHDTTGDRSHYSIISPSASTSYSVLEMNKKKHPNPDTNASSLQDSKPKSSGHDHHTGESASPLLHREKPSKSSDPPRAAASEKRDHVPITFLDGSDSSTLEQDMDHTVGKLLFGVDIGTMEFFEQKFFQSATSSTLSTLSLDGISLGHDAEPIASDRKNEHETCKSSAQEALLSGHQAKSCEDTKHMPPEKLTTEHDSTAAHAKETCIKSGALPVMPLPQDQHKLNASKPAVSHSFLITATLTTMHSKLISVCDQTLTCTLQASSGGGRAPFPEQELRTISHEVHKMSDMVEWETGSGPLSQQAVTEFFHVLNRTITESSVLYGRKNDESPKQHHEVASAVKEIIVALKQMANQSVCQYYKVFEHAMVVPCKGYKIEGRNKFGSKAEDYPDLSRHSLHDYTHSPIEHKDDNVHWFRSYFVGKDYATFFGYRGHDPDKPVLLSVVCDEEEGQKMYRVIIRDKKGPDTRRLIADSFLLNAPTMHDAEKQVISDSTWKAVLEQVIDTPYSDLRKMGSSTAVAAGIENDILKLDESKVHQRHKFGVLYVKEGQTKEEEWLSNSHDSEKFEQFLEIIGRRVELQGYTGWAAGLDTKSCDSGQYTYVNEWGNSSLAYHVSTLIPSRPFDKQQVQRKRHIGNDIVCIVFVEGKQPFNPAVIKSQFLHVFIIVHEEEWKGKQCWRVEVAMVEDIPDFGPPLPDKAIFFNKDELRSFMLVKLINAEYAALKSPKFAQPMARAREGILANLVERGWKIAHDTDAAHSRHHKTPSSSSEKSTKSTKSTRSINQCDVPDVTLVPSRPSMTLDTKGRGLKNTKPSKKLSKFQDEQRNRIEQGPMQAFPSAVPENVNALQSTDIIPREAQSKKDDRGGLRHKAQHIISSTLSTVSGRRLTHTVPPTLGTGLPASLHKQ